MLSKTFEGVDKPDLDKQIIDWKSTNQKFKELKRYPIEALPLSMTKTTPGTKIIPSKLVSIRIDYDEAK